MRPHAANGPTRTDRSPRPSAIPMSQEVMRIIRAADLAIVASSADGMAWAWPLAGSGIGSPLGPSLLRMLPSRPAPPELASQIERFPSVAILALDVATGTSAEISGGAAMAADRVAVAVDDARVNRPSASRCCTRVEAPGARSLLLGHWGRELAECGAHAFVATCVAGRPMISRCDAVDVAAGSRSRLSLRGRVAEHVGDHGPGDGRACLLFVDFPRDRWLQILVATSAGSGRELIGDVLAATVALGPSRRRVL